MFGKKKIRILHPLAQEFYSYHLGPRYDPGAQAETFNPHFQNPVYLFRGAGRVAGAMRVFEHPQRWFHQQTGINGVPTQAGFLRSQPLLDPEDLG